MAYKIVNDDSLTSVANAIRVQGSISGTLEFPDGFVSAIQNLSPSPTLQTKSVTYTPSDSAITDTVTADSGYDGLDEVDVTVNAVPEADFDASVGFQFYTEDGVKKCEVSGGGYAETAGWIDEGSVLTREVHPAIASGTTITPTTSSQTIGGYKNVMEGAVTINPIPSQYIVPSGTMSITSNGIYDIVSFASVDVQVSGGGGITADDIALRAISGVVSGSATSIYSSAFADCSEITAASFPNATVINTAAFQRCAKLETVYFPSARTLSAYAFSSCKNLTSASFPNVTSIGNGAFMWCSKLTEADFPNALSIGNSAFLSCTSLSTINFPSVSYIGSSAFASCSNLTIASFPKASTINGYAFAECINLTSAYFSSAKVIPSYAFSGCSRLYDVSIPNATYIGASAFYNCKSMSAINFSAVTSVMSYAFAMCTSVEEASFSKVTYIGSSAFYYCTKLQSLYILASSAASLTNVNAFYNTPINNSTYLGRFGSIYVPASLVDTYKSKANWSAYSARITSYVE